MLPSRHLRAATNTSYVLLDPSAAASYFGSRACAFLSYSDGVDDATQKTDTIVLTGGNLRPKPASPSKEGRANKLFVSGVQRGVDVRQLLRLARTSPSEAECCIQLGHAADDTAEAGPKLSNGWPRRNFRRFSLWMATYHMPRSLAEFNHAMPDAQSWFIRSSRPRLLQEWWRWRGTAFLILGEYSKYLIARTRHIFERLIE